MSQSCPLSGVAQHIHNLFLAGLILCEVIFIHRHVLCPCARDRVHVSPASGAWETHQDTFNAGTGRAQAKASSTIIDKVELHIAAPTKLLPLLLFWGVQHVLASLNDGHIGRKERCQTVRNEGEQRLLRVGGGAGGSLKEVGVEVIEEDTSNAAAFATVGDVEVLVTPGLEFGVVCSIVAIARILNGLVEVLSILREEVGRGQIRATSEPPVLVPIDRVFGVRCFEVAVIEMHCRSHGIVWVQDQRETGGEEI